MSGLPVEGAPVPDDHRLVRYCKPSSLENGEPGPTSFARRLDEEYVSVNDADMFGDPELKDRVSKSKALVAGRFSGMSKNGLLAVSRARAVRGVATDPSLEVKYHPLAADATRPANPFHGGFWNVPAAEELAATARATVLIDLAETVESWWKVADV